MVAEGALEAIDRLQLRWARLCLGLPPNAAVRHALVLLQCGWPYRLSTRVIEEAIVCLGRLSLLPPDRTGARTLRLAKEAGASTWFSVVTTYVGERMWGPAIMQIDAYFLVMAIDAQQDRVLRRKLLRKYRLEVVRPALAKIDEQYFLAAACKTLHSFAVESHAV